MSDDYNLTFPNETAKYRTARNTLLAEEAELRRQSEKISLLRRDLPLGGILKEDYGFQNLAGEEVRLSSLFSNDSSNLLIYGFMFKPGGDPCVVCTSLLDGLNGSAPHITQNLNFVVVAKAPVDELGAWAKSRNWSNLNILSSFQTTYNLDYHAEDETGDPLMMNAFRKADGNIFHHFGYEIKNVTIPDEKNPNQRDQIWPLWTIYEMTLDDRPKNWFPTYSYE